MRKSTDNPRVGLNETEIQLSDADRLAQKRAAEAAYRDANREAIRANSAKWRAANRELARQRLRAFLAANPGKDAEYSAAYRARDPEKSREIVARYRASHAEQEKAYCKAYAARNKDKLAAKAAARRAMKLQATPAWADPSKIAEAYALAQRLSVETGVEHHVDHAVPLKSKLVCGLHCEANLQVLTGRENLSKCNRHWPDMP